MTTTNNRQKMREMTKVGFLIALIVVLQTISALLLKFGFFSISLTLVPIVLGGFMLGPAVGTLLGGVFGVITFVFCAVGLDAAGAVLFAANPFLCGFICLAKAMLAGWIASLVYKMTKKSLNPDVHPHIWLFSTAAISGICPIVNTLVFCIGMTLFFKDILHQWAGDTDVAYYILIGLIGINFLIELCLNIVLCPLLARNLRKTKMFHDNF